MPPKVDKSQQAAISQKIADKTFGMKNKNKSKAVQQTIHQMKASAGVGKEKVLLPCLPELRFKATS